MLMKLIVAALVWGGMDAIGKKWGMTGRIVVSVLVMLLVLLLIVIDRFVFDIL